MSLGLHDSFPKSFAFVLTATERFMEYICSEHRAGSSRLMPWIIRAVLSNTNVKAKAYIQVKCPENALKNQPLEIGPINARQRCCYGNMPLETVLFGELFFNPAVKCGVEV